MNSVPPSIIRGRARREAGIEPHGKDETRQDWYNGAGGSVAAFAGAAGLEAAIELKPEGWFMKRNPKRLLIGLAIVVVALQLYQPERTNPPIEQARTVEAQTEIPPAASAIIHRVCFDCHSHQTRWPWYSFVAPVSWVVADDVEHARSHVNFSD